MPRVEANAKNPNHQTHQSWGWLTVGIRRILPFFLIPQANQWNKNWMEEELKMTAWICARLLSSRCKRFYVVKLDCFTKLENLEMDGNSEDNETDAILLWVFAARSHSEFMVLARAVPGVLKPWEMMLTNCAFRRHWCMRIQHDLGPRHKFSILRPLAFHIVTVMS